MDTIEVEITSEGQFKLFRDMGCTVRDAQGGIIHRIAGYRRRNLMSIQVFAEINKKLSTEMIVQLKVAIAGNVLTLDTIKKSPEFAGIGFGLGMSAEKYAHQVKYHGTRGHGFAAEDANHVSDIFSGRNAKIVGGDNAKHGADRIVNGQEIQTKYCKTGSKCISECFDAEGFLYFDSNGNPMQVEVPSDKYQDAVKSIKSRIEKGEIKGVTDPAQAEDIVRKGQYTYEQAKNIAKAGNIDSIVYDMKSGLVTSTIAMGISSIITFAVSIWNGDPVDVALQNAAQVGLQTFGITWVSSIVTAQVGRTGVEQSLRGATDWMVKQLGSDITHALANGLRGGANIYGGAAANHLSKLLRGNIVTGVITTVVLSSADAYRFFKDEVSGAQLFKNVAVTAASVAGGTAGWMGGAAGGAVIGSAVPVIGTFAGGIIGGILGSFAGGTASNMATKAAMDCFIKEDAEEMLEIVNDTFGQLAPDYLLNEDEANMVVADLVALDMAVKMREMYASGNRSHFSINLLRPLIEDKVSKRKKIKLPSNEQLMGSVADIIRSAQAA